MGNITLGRYVPYNTPIHKMDPRTKLFVMLGLLVSIFFELNLAQYILITVFVLTLLLISKTSIVSIFKSLKAMWMMMIILLIVNCFVIKTGDVWFNIWGLDVHYDAIYNILKVFVRLFIMISLTTILTATTKPLELTASIEWYFAPLKIIKFPAHEIAMTITIALRFIPTLLEETEKIMKAQASRGVDVKNGKFKEKIQGIISLIIPLFVSSFQRSDDLANAMEARGYNPSAKRTRYRQLHFTYRDLLAVIITGIIIFASLYTLYNPEILDTIWEFIKGLWNSISNA